MFHSPTLVQHLSDAKIADLRRDQRDVRTQEFRRDMALRIVRPLSRWRHH